MAFSYLAYASLAAFVYAVYRLSKVGSRPKGYPPGPPTLPLLGNIHQFPTKDEYLQFQKWAQEYGPIYSIFIGSQPIVVLSSGQAVKDLLEKRSAIYSDRMDIHVGGIVSGGAALNILFMHYGPTWRNFRKIIHSSLNVVDSLRYIPNQTLESRQLLHELLTTPDDFFRSIRRFTASTATQIVYGWRTPSKDDSVAVALYSHIELILEISQNGSAGILDAFPVLRRLPDWLYPIKARARKGFAQGNNVHMGNWKAVQNNISKGKVKPCLATAFVEAQNSNTVSEQLAAWGAGLIFAAGADTTSNELYAFVQAMLLFQDVQLKAQEEIDRVVGPDRLPTMDDAPQMPYLRACVKETLRWMPTAALGGAPHAATQDDEYMGYKIPKGAGVVNNVWTIHMDPERYPEPRRFNPDRFTAEEALRSSAESATASDPGKRDTFAFGAGRRICQGMHIADHSMFIVMSAILWAFSIKPKVDAQGREIVPDPDNIVSGQVQLPAPYEADIKPRSDERARIIRKEWETASKILGNDGQQWMEKPQVTSIDEKLKG